MSLRQLNTVGLVFWTDGVSSHCASKTLDKLNELPIKFVPRDSNPPNVPQLRPNETFWAHLKFKVYADGFVAKDKYQ